MNATIYSPKIVKFVILTQLTILLVGASVRAEGTVAIEAGPTARLLSDQKPVGSGGASVGAEFSSADRTGGMGFKGKARLGILADSTKVSHDVLLDLRAFADFGAGFGMGFTADLNAQRSKIAGTLVGVVINQPKVKGTLDILRPGVFIDSLNPDRKSFSSTLRGEALIKANSALDIFGAAELGLVATGSHLGACSGSSGPVCDIVEWDWILSGLVGTKLHIGETLYVKAEAEYERLPVRKISSPEGIPGTDGRDLFTARAAVGGAF